MGEETMVEGGGTYTGLGECRCSGYTHGLAVEEAAIALICLMVSCESKVPRLVLLQRTTVSELLPVTAE